MQVAQGNDLTSEINGARRADRDPFEHATIRRRVESRGGGGAEPVHHPPMRSFGMNGLHRSGRSP